MSQNTPGVKVSIEASDTIPAFAVVALGATRLAGIWVTSTSHILGVSERLADSGAACSIIVSGTAKVGCFASVPAGSLVTPATDAAGFIKAVTTASLTTTAYPRILGVALESGSTNSVIEVLLQVSNSFLPGA